MAPYPQAPTGTNRRIETSFVNLKKIMRELAQEKFVETSHKLTF
jgi:hypothetical protein